MNKSAASAVSPDCVKIEAVIKSAASTASLRGGRAGGRLDSGCLFASFGCASCQTIVIISDSALGVGLTCFLDNPKPTLRGLSLAARVFLSVLCASLSVITSLEKDNASRTLLLEASSSIAQSTCCSS